MSKATIMAVVNQKGGTGKTTTCENLGIGLAKEGKRVLLVDTDPQASLTIALGHPRPDEIPVTLTDLMAKVIQDQGSDCKVTGVGLPSEMAPYIENGICYDAYLWNPLDQGALGAYSAHALVTGAATGKVGDIVDAGDLGKFTIEEYYDGGTQVLLGEPLRFDKDNIAQWKDKF